jgi:predicted DNA-binding transcriptional regulator AlpA
MKQSAALAETPVCRLLKKRDLCAIHGSSPPEIEKMLKAGRIPPPIRLGETPQSRRWPLEMIERHVRELLAEVG